MSSEADNIRHTVDATVEREVAFRPWWAGLAIRYENLLGVVPSHRDTKKGRNNARQVKIVLLAAGVGTIAFVGGWWITLGCLLAALALLLPISKDKRRSLIASSRSARKNQTRLETLPAQIVWDGRRVVLKIDDKNERRVLTHTNKHKVHRRDLRGTLVIGLVPPSNKKSDCIWVVADGREANDEAALSREDVDLLAKADADELDELLHAIHAIEGTGR
jgi:hypothetical protein